MLTTSIGTGRILPIRCRSHARTRPPMVSLTSGKALCTYTRTTILTTRTNVTASKFFEVDFRLIVDKGLGDFDVLLSGTQGEYRTYRSLANLPAIEAYPNIWQGANILPKSSY